ncbi:MAG: glycoside hydrolase family 43 protein [Alistipes sp.]|nr:glycoside hydrolase family 43 protein [Alistipes sp.]
MKYLKLTTLLAILVATFACSTPQVEREVYLFTGFREPALDGLHLLYSYDGYKWDSLQGTWLTPRIGNQQPEYFNYTTGETEQTKFYPQSMMRDPSIVQGPDGLFHLVWTLGWSGDLGFGYASSKDLITWSEQQRIPVMEGEKTNNVWAPEIFYDAAKEHYMIVWSSSILPENYTEADKLGANGCHRMYYTTTKDFVEFAPRKPFYDPGFNSIDGFVLQKGEEEYIAIVKDNRKPGFSDLFAASATDAEGPYGQPSEKFAPTYSEGACAVKVGEDWLIYFDVYKQYRFGAVRTRDFQTFEPIDSLISVPAGHKHGTIVKVQESVLEALKAEEARRYGAQE